MTKSDVIFWQVVRFPYMSVLSMTLTIASVAFVALIIGNIVNFN
jgi:hypothetical protein